MLKKNCFQIRRRSSITKLLHQRLSGSRIWRKNSSWWNRRGSAASEVNLIQGSELVLTNDEWNAFWPTILTGLGIAVLHSSLPTHWLPFVSASRMNNWSQTKTLAITGLAGTGHVLITALLGALIVWFGVEIDERLGGLFHYLAASILFVIGAYYIFIHLKRRPHSHHECCGSKSDRMTIFGLLMVLTFSPCEAFLPVYLSAIKFGRSGFILLSMALAAGTAIGMAGLTWFALRGFSKLKTEALEKYESLLLGLLLWILAFATAFFE